MIVGIVGRREQEQHEPHRKGHGEGPGGFGELQVRTEIGHDDDGDGLHYVTVVYERSPDFPEVHVHGDHVVLAQHTGTRVHQVRDLQICWRELCEFSTEYSDQYFLHAVWFLRISRGSNDTRYFIYLHIHTYLFEISL